MSPAPVLYCCGLILGSISPKTKRSDADTVTIQGIRQSGITKRNGRGKRGGGGGGGLKTGAESK